MPARAQLSYDQEKEAIRYVSNPDNLDDELFQGCATEDEKVAKLFKLSAKEFAERTGRFSEEVDLGEVLSPKTRKNKRTKFKKMTMTSGGYFQERVDDAARAFHAYSMQSQFYKNAHHLSAFYGNIPPHTHAHAVTPTNLFTDGVSAKNSEDISQLLTVVKISNSNVDGLTTAVSDVKIALKKEGEERREGLKQTLQSNIDENTAGINENKGEIDQLKLSRAEDTAKMEQLEHKLGEETAMRQALENKVEGLLKEVATPAPKKKGPVLWKCANEIRTIPSRHSAKNSALAPANAKKPAASKKTDKSTPAVTRSSTRSSEKKSAAPAPLRRSTRTSVRRNGM